MQLFQGWKEDAETARHETARKELAAQKCRVGNCETWNQWEKQSMVSH